MKGYELGWRDADRIALLLGRPLDGLGGCRYGDGIPPPGPDCAGLVSEIEGMAAALPPTRDAPEALGARCGEEACSYGNVYLRRDVGVALVLPVFRKVVLREARGRFVRPANGRWRLDAFSLTDLPPPSYGPVRVGASPGGA